MTSENSSIEVLKGRGVCGSVWGLGPGCLCSVTPLLLTIVWPCVWPCAWPCSLASVLPVGWLLSPPLICLQNVCTIWYHSAPHWLWGSPSSFYVFTLSSCCTHHPKGISQGFRHHWFIEFSLRPLLWKKLHTFIAIFKSLSQFFFPPGA